MSISRIETIAPTKRLKLRDAFEASFKKSPLKNVQFCSISRKGKILTTGIHLVFRGLKFEPDAEIG